MALTKVQKEGIETLINNNADNRVITGSGTANTLNGESSVVIDANGKLGVGTTSPTTLLEVKDTSSHAVISVTADNASTSAVNLGDEDDINIGRVLYDHSDNSMQFQANNAERMRINSSGNVGIGNDASFPVYTHVNSRNFILGHGGESTALQIHSSSTTYGGIYFGDVADRTDAGSYIGSIEYKHGDDFMNFRTNGSERMRIDSSGNMMINSTITNNGTGNNTAGFCFQPMRLFGSGTGHAPLALNRSNDGIVALWYRGGNLVGNITVGSNSVAYNSTSDYRLKENVSSISDGITRLKTLKPSRFNFISEPSKTIDGFLAHEVTAVPEAISGTKDEIALEDNEDLDIKKGNPIYQTIDQSKLVPLLTAALQEAIAKIEVLETKVAALEAA